MSLIGSIAQRLANRRMRQMLQAAHEPREPQQRVLDRLLQQMRKTAFGREHGFDAVKTHDDLQRAVPLQNYQSLAPWWDRARAGERDVVWPGLTKFWAISSGTTSGEKFLPVTAATIANNKRGGFDSLVPHLANGGGRMFGGKLLFLGGSTTMRQQGEVFIGDNTGIMALQVPRCLRSLHAPNERIRALPSWEEKVAAAAAQTADVDLRMLAGVPSWIVLFGEAVLAHCQKSGRNVRTLSEVWPNLQLFVHGGVTFAPYAERCRELIGHDIRYTDTYSASEGGMLAVQDDPENPGMLPLLDRSTFFEFVPTEDLQSDQPRRFAIDEIETNVDYAVLLTTDSGIVSYVVGDIVRFTSRQPLRMVFAGRIAHTLNGFGEHLSGGEIERAVAAAANASNAIVSEFAVGVIYPNDAEAMGGHRYLVEFHREPNDPAAFARVLDDTLQKGNEDYATHRSYGLLAPAVESLPAGTFVEFMRKRGKIGGQHKVPRVLDPSQLADLDAAITHR
ncbi:MAG: hypothetical protein ACI9SE_002582 [Neolewinella sp.]|jgi:hypothetical protein